MERDAVDVIVEQWRRERPDLDLSAIGVVGRIMRLSLVLGAVARRWSERYGLGAGEFDVVTALRRSGPPYAVIPSELADSLLMSRSGMTKRLDRLEGAGLVRRRLDPADRRSVRVELTDEGRRLIDAVLVEHAANLNRLVSDLADDDRAALERSLRTLLHTAEHDVDAGQNP
ncbi:MarR family winged helix-turn-helix transcriptional regulator [Pseudonocardia acaciae]|uniref:MarR family winged helix-turn-helix transcriptional regulator n=1 Tax=Pseudonocardia acaciae TaxID=551276 RepID=UPI00048CEE6D|nr:MarR family transcriptional regulator [Pseudonocardia acaciae]